MILKMSMGTLPNLLIHKLFFRERFDSNLPLFGSGIAQLCIEVRHLP